MESERHNTIQSCRSSVPVAVSGPFFQEQENVCDSILVLGSVDVLPRSYVMRSVGSWVTVMPERVD